MHRKTHGLMSSVLILLLSPAFAAAQSSFTLDQQDGAVLLKTPDGKPVLRYVTKNPADSKLSANSACFLHPIYTPAGQVVTDLAPDDHRHHRGAFLGWFAMHGAKDADFWGWGQYAPTKDRIIENRSVKLASADADHATLAIRNEWMVEGEVMIDEQLRISARREGALYVIDWSTRLTPRTEVLLDPSAFGGFCVRSRKDGTFTILDAKGVVTLPDPHHLKPETDWPSADWYALSLKPSAGNSVGLAVIDHPDNPRTRWHNNRAVWMINPCITALGSVVFKPDQPLMLRYRMVACDGEVPAKDIDRLAGDWRHTYRARYLRQAEITLDGRPTESAWSQAAVEKRFSFPWKSVAAPPTEFRALCDDHYLYFTYRATDPDIVVLDQIRDKEDIVFEDRVEMILSRDDALKEYYSVEIDSRGRFLEYSGAFYRKFDTKWKWEGFEATASPIEQGYVVEGRIPQASFEKLGFGRLKSGSRIRCGLYRAEFSHDRSGRPAPPSKHMLGRRLDGPPPIEDWISWVDPKTPEPDFHVPASLGWLLIED